MPLIDPTLDSWDDVSDWSDNDVRNKLLPHEAVEVLLQRNHGWRRVVTGEDRAHRGPEYLNHYAALVKQLCNVVVRAGERA